MITLRQMAAEVHRILSGGQLNTDSEYDNRYTISLIRSAMADALRGSYLTRRQLADDRGQESMYIATYPSIDVSFDETTERSYANLPDFYMSLPYNKGIHSVSAMNTPLKPMIRKNEPQVSAKIPAGGLLGQIGYYIEGLKIFWDEKISEKSIKKVLIKLIVPAPDTIGEDDPLPITPNQRTQVREQVLASYRGEGIQDRIVDGNKDLGVKTRDE